MAHFRDAIYENGNPVYTTGRKPSAADVGAYSKSESDGRYLGKTAKAHDSDLFDGVNSDRFYITSRGSLDLNKLVSTSDHSINPSVISTGHGKATASGATGAYYNLGGDSSIGKTLLVGNYNIPYYLVSWTDNNASRKRVQKIYTDMYKPTKADVGLSNVPNYTITASTSDASDSKFATAGAVKKAFDQAENRSIYQTPNRAKSLGSSDLNSITTAGFYYQTSNSATSGKNYPTGRAGSLLVQKSAGKVTQQYTCYDDGRIFTRSYYTSWSGWKTIVISSDTISKATWADTVDVNTSTSTSYYGVTWHSGDTLYASENHGFVVRPSDGHVKIMHGMLGNERISVQSDGCIVGSGSVRYAGNYGTYDSHKIGHIWSMGTAYKIHSSGTNFGKLYGLAYKHTTNPTGGTMGGGHQMVWCVNGSPKNSLGESGIWSAGNITAYSDKRVKTNIKVIPEALDKVSKLSGYTFERTDVTNDDGTPIKQTGVIAQEVLEVLPEAVTGNEEDHYAVAYGNLVGLLIESIKELKAEVEELKKEK